MASRIRIRVRPGLDALVEAIPARVTRAISSIRSIVFAGSHSLHNLLFELQSVPTPRSHFLFHFYAKSKPSAKPATPPNPKKSACYSNLPKRKADRFLSGRNQALGLR
jgi:hypothetical protein